MSKPRLLIIGAGLSGLSAGCYAQINGYEAHLFEHHSIPGGVCTAWARNGYTIDGCVQWLMGSKEGSAFHALYRELGALEGVTLLPVTFLRRFVDEESGEHLDISADLDKFAADVRALAPDDAQVIERMLEGVRTLEGFEAPVETAPELLGPLDAIQSLWRSRRQLKYLSRYGMPVSEFVEELRNPLLKKALLRLFVPEMPMYYLMSLLAQLSDGQLSVIKGGSHRFALAVARRFRELGGVFHFNADVEEILVEGNRAVGLRLADGSEAYGERVVSAAPGHTTIFRMLGGRYTDRSVRDRYTQWPMFPGRVLVSFGVRAGIVDVPPVQTILLRDPLIFGFREVDCVTVRTFNYDDSLAPEGCTVVQVIFETDYEMWNELHHAPRRYDRTKTAVADEVLSILEGHIPGISEQVEMRDVATPYTFWRFARSYRGAYEGFLPTPEALRERIPKMLPGLEGFYMAGQWVEPGGGVPPALMSGKHVVQLICREDEKSFRSSP